MSQADEKTASYKLHNHYKYIHYGQMRKTENNQQVMPLYENCTLNNNNNKQKPDHIVLGQSPTNSEAFKYDYCFVEDTTNTADINEQEARDTDRINPDYEYENIHFDGKEYLDKKILLQKYFRSALVGPRSNVYENLCRGCNYGVFNARGPLCTFCECIVNGVSALKSDTPETSITTNNNVYENICENCGFIYGGAKCTECECRPIKQVKSDESIVESINVSKLGSEELLIEKSEKQKKKIKLNKSKSFNKSNKPKIFTNFWDTLRKPKNAATSTVNKKPLEIIHHVDGYEQVFHTKDTFDLKKICELKRSGTSYSDQHIYGRLKQNDLTVSQDEFNSTQSLTQSSNSLTVLPEKKPRITKAKFLRTAPSESSINFDANVELSAATIYLNSSVCHWMTSLRREIHTYNTHHQHDQDTLCYPKSIPSKNILTSCKALVVTNHSTNSQDLQQKQASDSMKDSWEIQETEKSQQQPDCYQLMVEKFIANILNRQMLKTTHNSHQTDNVKGTMASANNNHSHANNYNNNDNNTIDMPLRQATMTATTITTNNHNNNNNNNNNKNKRQGIYLRLEDHQQLQQYIGEEEVNLLKAKHEEQLNMAIEKMCECEYLNCSLRCENNAVSISDTSLISQSKGMESINCCIESSTTGCELIKTNKRRGIHERNILEAFEDLLQQERTYKLYSTNKEELNLDEKPINQQKHKVSQKCEAKMTENSLSLSQQIIGDSSQSISLYFPTQVLDIIQLINQLHLSLALNKLIICYDKYLKVFLHYIYETNTNTRTIVYKIPNKQLVRKFKQFYNYGKQKNTEPNMKLKTTMRELTCVSSKSKLDLNVSPNGCSQALTQINNINNNESLITENCEGIEIKKNLKAQDNQKSSQRIRTPPEVPKRDPKTKLSPTSENKKIIKSKMTKPGSNLKTETKSANCKEEESIYQPIWKFETKGKVAERYKTDDDYYDLKALKEKIQQSCPNTEIPKILVSDEILPEEEEDHNNWEPDEEFVFTKQMKKQRSSSLTSDRITTIHSIHSSNSSIGTSSSLSGSTITEFASSTATLASTISCSLKHYLFRNIGIFYSLTEPKLRAIMYDYDRIHSSKYFAKPVEQPSNRNDSGLEKSWSPVQTTKLRYTPKSLSVSSSRSTSATSSPVCGTKSLMSGKSTSPNSSVEIKSYSFNDEKTKLACSISSSTSHLIPSSVQAWKYQLLDINYIEDEEDMIVSECEILRAQQIKEDIDQSLSTQPQQFMQRFKSRSTENFLDLPIEDDKKTIAERLANMYTRFSPIQRGILNINGRNSPKSEKKAYKLNRASQSASLYLEDGLKPKYPIFGATLDQLELQQNVPRFVVDAVDYIERKDRITQDGIYRACGNKFSIDELKQKLTKSYIYDSKLIVSDDIHTVTSLLKQFFRDLPEPVVPQEIYSRITTNLSDKQSVDTIRIAIELMKEPNKSTLRFLMKHLTNVAACSSSNRMNASNVAIVWGPSLFAQNDTYDMIGRMNTLTKVLIENYDRIFDTNERLL